MFYYVLSKKKFLIVLFLTLILFLGIGAIRLLTITYDDRSNVEYLKDYSDIDYDANLVEVYLGLYSTNNFTTLKRFVKTADDANYLGLGVYTFKPVFTLLGLSKFDSFDINKDLDSFSALGTYAIEPYLDFGLIGVIFINLFYGIFVSYTYKRYREGKERWIVPWGVMAFCLVMAAFTNFFNTFFVWFVLTLNFLILAPSNNYGKNNILYIVILYNQKFEDTNVYISLLSKIDSIEDIYIWDNSINHHLNGNLSSKGYNYIFQTKIEELVIRIIED